MHINNINWLEKFFTDSVKAGVVPTSLMEDFEGRANAVMAGYNELYENQGIKA